MNQTKQAAVVFLAALLILSAAAPASGFRKVYRVSGKTMGTFYTVKFISTRKESAGTWKKKIETRLREVNNRLSMYDPDSELSVFNRERPHYRLSVSTDFHAVLLASVRLYRLTDGAWDGTIKPLVDLWGFGTREKTDTIPDPGRIRQALRNTGLNHIRVRDDRTVLKTADVTLDLGSIAKGYGVDALSRLFLNAGIKDVLVEIGGELSAHGQNIKHQPWSVGISRPEKTLAGQQLYKVIRLHNQSIATSGDYRNFFEIGGVTYSHILNPKTGFPVTHNIVSASVISRSCTFADGLATALMVMPAGKGIELVNRLENTECLIILKKADGLVELVSDGFEQFTAKSPN